MRPAAISTMNCTNASRILTGISIACLLPLLAPRAHAVAGVGDTTIIAGDLTDTWKWPRELQQWTLLINSMTDQVRKTDELIKRVGDPNAVAKELIGSVPTLMAPIENAVSLKTRTEILDLSRKAYGLNSAVRQVYRDGNKVVDSYEAFGHEVKRDPTRYVHLAMEEAMYDRYKQAVDNEESVAKKEMALQKDTLAALNGAKTESEVQILHAKLDASKQRQDLAHQRAVQAKGELDAFKGQLVVEDTRKAEADREWAQNMVDEMRNKALASYRAQVGMSDPADTP